MGFEPKPLRGRIPIWVGGNSAAAHRRTALYGDAFYPVFSPPAAVGEQIGGYAAVGVSHMTLDIARGGGVGGQIEALEEFSVDVLGQLD